MIYKLVMGKMTIPSDEKQRLANNFNEAAARRGSKTRIYMRDSATSFPSGGDPRQRAGDR